MLPPASCRSGPHCGWGAGQGAPGVVALPGAAHIRPQTAFSGRRLASEEASPEPLTGGPRGDRAPGGCRGLRTRRGDARSHHRPPRGKRRRREGKPRHTREPPSPARHSDRRACHPRAARPHWSPSRPSPRSHWPRCRAFLCRALLLVQPSLFPVRRLPPSRDNNFIEAPGDGHGQRVGGAAACGDRGFEAALRRSALCARSCTFSITSGTGS